MDMLSRILRYASLLMAAVMLFSCQGTIDPEGMGDGTGNENIDGGNENGGNENGGNTGTVTKKELVIDVDKKFVQTFGDDYVTLSVTLGGEPVTENVTFLDASDNIIHVEDFKFMTTVAGEHKITANYGTYFSNSVTVTAIAVAIPETPEDPNESSTDFKSRVLLTQFTTTGCTWCPSMKLVLKDALNEQYSYSDKVVKVDCHASTMNRNDPAYVHLGEFYEQCDGLLPSVNLDMFVTTGYMSAWGYSGTTMRAMIDERLAFKAGQAAGIAVNAVATDNQIVAKVVVKAAETGPYRVGLMLLEDKIVASSSQTQIGTGAQDWMNTHNSVVRYMDAKESRYYYGHPVGEIAAGDTEEYVFILDLASIWNDGMLRAQQNGCTWATKWVNEELHLAVFATTAAADGTYYVSNVVDCGINEVTPYEYN